MCALPVASKSNRTPTPTASPPARLFHRASDAAVSEVIGQILMFGILSMVLILSLLGFNAAKQGAEDRVAELEADSAAQRVAGVYISASLFSEQNSANSLDYQRLVDLPDRIQQRDYTISIQSESLTLSIPTAQVTVTTSLLSAGAAPELVVCNQANFAGGPLLVRARDYVPGDELSLCTNRTTESIILYLESA